MTIREHEGLIVREFGHPVPSYLRYQIGRPKVRMQIHPTYVGLKKLVGTHATRHAVNVFELLAWGVDEKKARAMFDRKFPPAKIDRVPCIPINSRQAVVSDLTRGGDWRVQVDGCYQRERHSNNA